MIAMFIKRGKTDQNVAQIDQDKPTKKLTENVIEKLLADGWNIM